MHGRDEQGVIEIVADKLAGGEETTRFDEAGISYALLAELFAGENEDSADVPCDGNGVYERQYLVVELPVPAVE